MTSPKRVIQIGPNTFAWNEWRKAILFFLFKDWSSYADRDHRTIQFCLANGSARIDLSIAADSPHPTSGKYVLGLHNAGRFDPYPTGPDSAAGRCTIRTTKRAIVNEALVRFTKGPYQQLALDFDYADGTLLSLRKTPRLGDLKIAIGSKNKP